MKKSQYNPEIHHPPSSRLRRTGRRSIRLKGHDYAGGGLYFVTICAHRDAGNIFLARDIKDMIAREWEAVGAGLVSAHGKEGRSKAYPYAIMPDHFHGLICIPARKSEEGGHEAREKEGGHEAREKEGGHEARPYGLGDAICQFKSRVVHEYIAKVKAGEWPSFLRKIWHRNYYEMIVRDEEAERNISEYIRMNPWKLIISGSHEGGRFRAIGNSNLLNLPKIGVLCSRRVPDGTDLNPPDVDGGFMSGFHSPPERDILKRLLENGAKIICCPSWGIDKMHIPSEWLPALEENRMMIMEMTNSKGNRAASEERNRFVLQVADEMWVPHVTPGGMLDRL